MNDPLEPSRETKNRYGAKPNGKTAHLPKWTPAEGDDAQAYADYLNEVWPALGNDPIVGAERFGRHGDAAIALIRRSGERIHWNHQTTLMSAAGLQGAMTVQAGVKPLKMSALDAMTVAWAVIGLSDLRADPDLGEEVVSWWHRYVETRKIREGNPDDGDWRTLLAEWQAARTYDEYRKPDDPRHTFIVIDARDGERYVRREDFCQHARALHKGGLSWPTLNSRLAEQGWQLTRFQMAQTSAGAPYIDARCYVVPADWPEPRPDDPQARLDIGR